ncbi:MAG: hypothetical protein ABIJ46_03775 [bacterium]
MVGEKMKIAETNRQIRDLFNESVVTKNEVFLIKQKGDWDQFCVALDTIADTCFAIETFQEDRNNSFFENPYLQTYGLLQALFIQQDAVNFLKQSLFGEEEEIKWKEEYPGLSKIRQIRNETIGHPTKTKNKGKKSLFENDEITYCTIDRSTLSKDGFEYLLWGHSETGRKQIMFTDIICEQDMCLKIELEKIAEEIRKRELEHKIKFKENKLAGFFDKPTLYERRRMYGIQWDNHLAWPTFDYHCELYERIKSELEDRYGKLSETASIPGTREVIGKLDFIFKKIKAFKINGNFENYEIEIFIDALIAGLDELEQHLEGIDREFEI